MESFKARGEGGRSNRLHDAEPNCGQEALYYEAWRSSWSRVMRAPSRLRRTSAAARCFWAAGLQAMARCVRDDAGGGHRRGLGDDRG